MMNGYFVKLLRELTSKPSDRKRITVYVSEQVFAEFRDVCKKFNLSTSETLEHILTQFAQDAQTQEETKQKDIA